MFRTASNRNVTTVPIVLAAILGQLIAPGGRALAVDFLPQSAAPASTPTDAAFSKTRYSSVKQPNETDVDLSITDSKIVIKGRKAGKKAPAINLEIPFASIDSMSYEMATRHRVSEGAAVMALSLGAGAILMATKTKSHWLAIEHGAGDAAETTILRLDKSEYEGVIAALEARSGQHVAMLDSKTSSINPTSDSKDVDEMVPFATDKVMAALKPAMESQGCKVTEAAATSAECKRSRGYSEQTGSGGESVTATLEAKGDHTRVRIATGKGFVGRMGKKNWSTPIYDEMMRTLRKPTQ